jgi:hypothetical protein
MSIQATEWRRKNPEKAKAIRDRYRRLYPDRVSETKRRHRDKMKLLDPMSLKLVYRLRRRIRRVLKGKRRVGRIHELLGCSTEELKLHLVRKFQLGMTFFNHGTVWHIHHIVPCGEFDLTNPEDQRRCFHYTNLMPLFAGQNMRIQP